MGVIHYVINHDEVLSNVHLLSDAEVAHPQQPNSQTISWRHFSDKFESSSLYRAEMPH
jgi:hypothetical protein